jgi:hypothetical protein
VSAFQRLVQGAGRGAAARATTLPAPRTLTLKPEHFAATWPLRPSEPTLVGLRVPPEKDFEGAAIEARRSVADKALPDGEGPAAFQRAYARILVARAFCDPLNVLAPHHTLPLPDDQIARALTPATIQWLFDEVDKLNVEQSPGYAEATDEEIARLLDVLSLDDPFGRLGARRIARVRRYLGLVASELES